MYIDEDAADGSPALVAFIVVDAAPSHEDNVTAWGEAAGREAAYYRFGRLIKSAVGGGHSDGCTAVPGWCVNVELCRRHVLEIAIRLVIRRGRPVVLYGGRYLGGVALDDRDWDNCFGVGVRATGLQVWCAGYF